MRESHLRCAGDVIISDMTVYKAVINSLYIRKIRGYVMVGSPR